MIAKETTKSASTEGVYQNLPIYVVDLHAVRTRTCTPPLSAPVVKQLIAGSSHVGCVAAASYVLPVVAFDGGRCLCNPLWAHTGTNCDKVSWTSWVLVVGLGAVGVLSVVVLESAAKKLSATPTRCGAGLLQMARMLCQRQEEEGVGVQSTSHVHLEKQSI